MHDLNPYPTSPRYLYTYALMSSCEASIRCDTCPSSPRYLYTYPLIPSCDAPDPGVNFFFFFMTVQVCRDKEISIVTDFLFRTHVPYHARIPVEHACMSCASGSIMGDRAPLSCTALSRQNFSLFWPTLSRHRIALSRHDFSLP